MHQRFERHEGLISFFRIVHAVVYASQRCAVILSFAFRIYFHVLSNGDFLVLSGNQPLFFSIYSRVTSECDSTLLDNVNGISSRAKRESS